MRAGIVARHLAVLAIGASALSAQQVVRGRVVDSLKGPLAGVEISSGELKTRSGADGTFVLAGFALGTSRLVLRHFGYAPLALTVKFFTPDTLEQTFAMARLTSLDTVTVRGDSSRLGPVTFERRRRDIERTGFGRVLDEAFLTRTGNPKLGTLISLETGFKTVTVRGQTWVASKRMTTSVSSGFDRPGNCYAQVFLDGVRIFAMGTARVEPPNIDEYSISTIYAVELYRGASDTPPELNGTGSACGTVAIWTKR